MDGAGGGREGVEGVKEVRGNEEKGFADCGGHW